MSMHAYLFVCLFVAGREVLVCIRLCSTKCHEECTNFGFHKGICLKTDEHCCCSYDFTNAPKSHQFHPTTLESKGM